MASDLLGSMRVEIVGDNKKLDKSIDTSKKKTEDFSKNTSKLGANLGKLFAGIGFAVVAKKLFDLGKQAEQLFQIQETAEAKLDATLLATGHAAGLTAEELKKMATELQAVTKVGDEATIGAQSLLLTFKDIGGDVFPRALESILDVSEAMGQDLKSSTIQIGKALNDPIKGLAALGRVGIQFSDVQKDLITGFQKSGDLASAQGVILEELESQFGGVARAAALTAEGVQQQLNNSFGDLLETIGEVIAKGMTPYRASLRKEVESVNLSIQAHLLRKKALEGNATLVEELTLKQIEQEKAEERLAQAKANIVAAESQVIDEYVKDEAMLIRLEAAKQRAIETARNTVTALEDEVTLRTIGTKAAEDALKAEQELVANNILLAQGIDIVSESTDENTESTDENTLSLEDNLTAAQKTADERIAIGLSTEEAIKARGLRIAEFEDELREERLKLEAETAQKELDLWEDTEKKKQELRATTIQLIGDGLRAIDSLSSNLADSELQRLEESGASEEELDKKKKEIELKAAKRRRLIALFDITIGTAAAIAQAIPNWPLVLATAAVGTVQTAAVLATPVPSFANGGIVAGSNFVGDNVPALVNSGEAIINRTDQKNLMDFIQGGSRAQGMNGMQQQMPSQNVTIQSLFALGNEQQLRQAAKILWQPLRVESNRRGAGLGI